ncbi:hypothetical protein [Streptomyces sp. WAC08241]|uniref:hypothetical protein n=1 Tax=Streptomyces sp. WAC08241 TaxID=2487421 RepID=UPI000F7937D0|nr:hypothetical protein [Streptomyces sp. WAC08241]RSS37456.1 hypothetical protein EF906_23055 [Streptomyces sp. WAC08241]
MSDFTVSVYQTYVSCAPGRRTWLYISSINRTTGKAGVTDPNSIYTNYRPRTINLTQLHSSGRTRSGKERRSGYRFLSQPSDTAVHLCRHCFHYKKPEELHQEPGVIHSDICVPCKAEVAELMKQICQNRALMLED